MSFSLFFKYSSFIFFASDPSIAFLLCCSPACCEIVVRRPRIRSKWTCEKNIEAELAGPCRSWTLSSSFLPLSSSLFLFPFSSFFPLSSSLVYPLLSLPISRFVKNARALQGARHSRGREEVTTRTSVRRWSRARSAWDNGRGSKKSASWRQRAGATGRSQGQGFVDFFVFFFWFSSSVHNILPSS